MNPPHPVRQATERAPRDRPQNVPVRVTPPAVQDFAYYRAAFATGFQARYLSVWGYPWWLADEVSAPTTGGFDTGFSSGFEGGIDSPQGAAFSSGFSSGFGQ